MLLLVNKLLEIDNGNKRHFVLVQLCVVSIIPKLNFVEPFGRYVWITSESE